MRILLVLLFVISCGFEREERQEILLSYPEISAMTVGLKHPFVVGLNLPANGGEVLNVIDHSGMVDASPSEYKLSKGDMYKTFTLYALYPGEAKLVFSLDGKIVKTLRIWIYPEPRE